MRVPVATVRLLPRIALSAPRLALRLSPRGRRRLMVLLLAALALGALYIGWFRDSSFVRVRKVEVTGLDTPDGARIRAELTAAATGKMTTLHVNEDALRAAVRNEPLVRSFSVSSGFPHRLQIDVVENRPVALLSVGGRRVAVAPGGALLQGARIDFSLPAIRVRALPQGSRLVSPSLKELVSVVAAAPVPLLVKLASVSHDPAHGLVVRFRSGPEVWFGGPGDLASKWRSATAVLAQRSSRGAAYVDVRMPARPVAGGLNVTNDPQPLAQQGPGGGPAVIPATPGSAPTPPGIPAVTPGQPTAANPGAAAPAQAQAPATTTTTNPHP